MKRNNIARSLIIFCICAILLYYVYTLFRIGSLLIYIFQLIFPVIIHPRVPGHRPQSASGQGRGKDRLPL